MKKLMIAVAIVCASAMSQAASVVWGSDAIQTPDTAQNITKSRVNVYYYQLSSPSDDLMSLCLTAAGTGDATTWTVNNGYTASSVGGALDNVAFATGALSVSDPATYSIGNTAYGAILITRDTAGDGLGVGDWYMIAQGSQSIEADTTYTPMMADLTQSGWTQFQGGTPGPDPVPEPTSGLLLLMGIAGLALKRKHA